MVAPPSDIFFSASPAHAEDLLSELVQGKDIEDCVKAGHWSAKYIIQQPGTTIDKPCDYKA